MKVFGLVIVLCLNVETGVRAVQECARRNYGGKADSVVCVCNMTYCDEFPPLGKLADYDVAVYASSKAGKRFERSKAKFSSKSSLCMFDSKQFFENSFLNDDLVTIKIDASKTFQSIHGFGGAFTDAAGVNLNRLDIPAADLLLRAYFSTDGIEYTLGRVPIASCDFSTFEYSYLDTPDDFELKTFSLATEDFELKIPYLLTAMNLTDNQLKLFASPWSSPGWMKTNGRMKGGGKLKGEFNGRYYQTYAQYFVRFFEEYHKRGVPFWGVTIENEPSAGLNPWYSWQALYLGYEMQRDFANELLGPALRKNPVTRSIKIMAHDDQRSDIAAAARAIYNRSDGPSTYIDGLAVHWYSHSSFDVLTEAHNVNPDKFILATEACNAYAPSEHAPVLGDWERGESYGHDIIQDLLNYVTGWTDWNLCLNEGGGPNWVGNFVDAPIIVNNTINEFYKNPMFYYMGHFSKFIRPGSLRVQSTIRSSSSAAEPLPLEAVAFSTPKNHRVLVVHNVHATNSYSVAIEDANIPGKKATVTVDPKSIATFVWQKPSVKAQAVEPLMRRLKKLIVTDGSAVQSLKSLWHKVKQTFSS